MGNGINGYILCGGNEMTSVFDMEFVGTRVDQSQNAIRGHVISSNSKWLCYMYVSDFLVNDSQELCPSQDHLALWMLTEMVRKMLFSKDNAVWIHSLAST